MSEWEDKLNTLLSDPDSMSRIMQLAQSMSAPPKDGEPSATPKGTPPPEAPPPKGGGASPLGDLLGGLDPAMIARYLPLLQRFGTTNTNTQQLLVALKPFLKEEKQAKVDRAARLAKLFVIAKEFFANWEG
jgi:hypothetical protein